MTGHDGGRHLDRGCCVRSSVACVGLIRFRTSGEKANKGNCQEKREQAARRRDAVEQNFILQGKNHSPSFHIYSFEQDRSAEHTSELQSLMRTSYAVFCLKKQNK